MSTKSKEAFAALWIPEFRNFQLSRFLLTFAVQMAEMGLSWKIYQITNDKLALGLIGLFEALPFITTSLFSGHLADIYNRYRIARNTILGIFGCFSVISILFFFQDKISAETLLWGIYIMIGCSGIVRGFMAPAYQSIFPQLVPKELYANAATWGSNTWQTAAVTGPALGGFMLGYFGITFLLFIALLLMLLSYFVFLKIPIKPTPAKEKQETLFESLTAGLRFVWHKKIMLGAISLDLFAVLFGGAVALLPVFAKDILHVGPAGLGMLRAAPFLGSVAMGVLLAFYTPVKNAGRNLLIAVAFFGLATIGFALSTSFLLSVLMLFFTGAFDNVSVVIRQTILQTYTPDDMRGRVSAINQIFIASSNEIGAFESGITAKYMGTIRSVLFGGCMTLVVVSSIGLFNKPLRKLKM